VAGDEAGEVRIRQRRKRTTEDTEGAKGQKGAKHLWGTGAVPYWFQRQY
jgi:hypothetical protein